ncbi:hypothetical protein PsYK624_066330 [Phanerochaete sordida]|uniref:Uncharacterized protein n=1 Tax=Phanerochaete sordida TaxID=48140 RepID=A0A9P3GAS2_9APHY|nr:hypothetical protein PsYK624_066330 [Phanerochaete sordida]
MRFNTGFLLLASMIAFKSQTLALSIRVDGGDLAARAIVESREVVEFAHVDNDVMAPHDVELVRRVGWTYHNNQKLLLAIIAKNAFVIKASCGSGNVVICAIGATYSVLTFFFAAWFFADRRALDGGDGVPHFVFGPTPDMTLRERVAAELAPGQWHALGHIAHGGLNHTVHYFGRGGGVHTLRAETAPFWNETTLDRRQEAEDESNDGGFVADYSWNSNNKGPYDAFHSTSDGTMFFADNAAGYMINSQQAISACAGFQDASGFLDNGVLAYGWNGQPYNWQDGQLDATFDMCQNELGDGPQ